MLVYCIKMLVCCITRLCFAYNACVVHNNIHTLGRRHVYACARAPDGVPKNADSLQQQMCFSWLGFCVCRLQGIANNQGAQHNEILREGQGDTRAWRQAKEGQKQLQLFFERLADCLMCGLMLLMAGMFYWGVTLGFYQGRLSECSGTRPGYLVKVWKPWHAVESLQTLWCQFVAFADLIAYFVVMLFTVWVVKRHQLLSNSIAQPMTGLVLGLGAVGGTAGWLAIGKVGGDAMVWLSGYWLWVGVHVVCVWFLQDVHKAVTHKAAGGFCKQFFAFAKLPLFYALMGFVLPLAVAASPFWKLIDFRTRIVSV